MTEETRPIRRAGTKTPTGIDGFDRMTGGGLPAGRISAVIGATGAGKTVFAVQTLRHMLKREGHCGVLVSFEQSPEAIISDFSSFEWGISDLVASGRLLILDGRPDPDALFSGAFDIAGLLAGIEAIGADKPLTGIVFDGMDALLSLIRDPARQRQELLRLQTLADRLRTTALLTLKAKSGEEGTFEELALYMADCVVELIREMDEHIASRSIRVQKYRGSAHALGRQPFLLTEHGLVVEGPHSEDMSSPQAFGERLPTGLERLDGMLAGGFYRASTTLLSGAPGTAKTTLGSLFLSSMCERGETALFVGFDEASDEAVRNMKSVGIDLDRHVESGRLHMRRMVSYAAGPDEIGHEIAKLIETHKPDHLLIDPISVFSSSSRSQDAVRRIILLCKRRGITVIMTSLLDRGVGEIESTRSHISSICDTWIHLSYVVNGGERNRGLTIIKARGTAHSNQVGELVLSNSGVSIADVYTEDGAVLMGSLRWQRERANLEETRRAAEAAAGHYRDVELAAEDLARRIAGLNVELEDKHREMELMRVEKNEVTRLEVERRAHVLRMRGGKVDASPVEMEGQ